MIFTATAIPGAFVVDPEPQLDERGLFARVFARDDFESRGLAATVVQCSVSWNAKRATLRGMHYQEAPYGECKLVRCTSGALYDVIVDLRAESPAYLRWVAVELTAENRRALYVPEGVAHGFETLADGTEVFYQISQAHHPAAARGVRWDDPAFAIRWPEPPQVVSERDRLYPDFRP